MSTIKRFSISLDNALLEKFKRKIMTKGYANRSQAMADLIRKSLVNIEWDASQGEVIGTVTLVYNHHRKDIVNQLVSLQHQFHQGILATTHIHMDKENCLEVLVVKGKAKKIREVYNQLGRLKGIKFSDLSTATTGRHLT